MEWTEHQAEGPAGGLNFAALTPSAAPPLVFLHGVTRCWRTFAPLAGSLAPRWRLHALDFRGHGRSAPSRAGEYRVIDYVEDAERFLTTQFDSPVVLYGHSLGAMVAAATAARLPDRVSAVVLEDPPMRSMGDRIGEGPLLHFFRSLQPFAGDERSVSEIASELAEIRLQDARGASGARLGNVRDAASLRFTAACLRKLDAAVMAPIVAGQWLEGYDVESIFANVRCPTLLVQADMKYGGMLHQEDADRIERLAAEVAVVRIPECGHLVHWTHTQRLLAAVHAWLESLV